MVAVSLEPRRSSLVTRGRFVVAMKRSIELYDQSDSRALEVGDIGTYRMLPSELPTFDLSTTKPDPHAPFRSVHGAQFAGEFGFCRRHWHTMP